MKIGTAGVPPSKFVILPLSGNIGIDAGHDTLMLPYPSIKLPKPHVTTYLSFMASIFHSEESCTDKHFPHLASLRSIAVLSSRAHERRSRESRELLQSPRGFSALARLY